MWYIDIVQTVTYNLLQYFPISLHPITLLLLFSEVAFLSSFFIISIIVVVIEILILTIYSAVLYLLGYPGLVAWVLHSIRSPERRAKLKVRQR